MMRIEDYRRQQQQLASIDPEGAKSKAKLGRRKTRQDKTRLEQLDGSRSGAKP
jgi:hypothetical protein